MRRAIKMPVCPNHPNRAPFAGCLTIVGEPSSKSPGGARGRRVILTHRAALEALPTILGMAVSFKADWSGHDARNKCGVITAARLDGNRLMVEGHVYAKDFPEVRKMPKGMGMSFELHQARVKNMLAKDVYTITKTTFTGAAILLKTKAAYFDTSFELQEREAK